MLSDRVSDVAGYYLGIKKQPDGVVAPKMQAYFGGGVSGGSFADTFLQHIPLIESFCFADHASLIGYQKTAEGRVGPVFGHSNDALLAWGLSTFQRAICEVAEELWLDPLFVDLGGDMRAPILRVLNQFEHRPSALEAGCWCKMPWEDSVGTHAEFHTRGRRLSIWDAIRLVWSGRVANSTRSHWLAGSFALSGWTVRRFTPKALKIRSRIRNLIKSRIAKKLTGSGSP